MDKLAWLRVFPGAITATDADGIILSMNDQSTEMFKDEAAMPCWVIMLSRVIKNPPGQGSGRYTTRSSQTYIRLRSTGRNR
jgi:hypothetical protein